MTITYVATGTDSAANSTSVSVSLPAGITTGDVMVLHVLARGTASTISTPAGWTVGPGDSNLAFTNGHRAAWFYRVATSSESAPTVTQSVSALIYAEISAWRGCDQSHPIDIDSVSDGSTAATTFAAPSVTPVSANAMVLWLFSTPDDNTLNAGSQGTTRYSVSTVTGNDGSLALISLLETTATASGTTSLTQSVNGPDNWVTFAFALRPAAVAAADPSTTTKMGYKFAVEMAFGSTPYTPNPVWTDVSADVRKEAGITIQRGRDSEFSDAQPGTCTFTLNNRGRKYDPDYTAGTYYGQLLPMVQVRVRVRVGSTNYTLYTGFVQSWEQSYDYPNEAICVVSCVDLFVLLNQKQIPVTTDLGLQILAAGPEAYFQFNESGTTAVDAAGHWDTSYGAAVATTDAFMPFETGNTVKYVANNTTTAASFGSVQDILNSTTSTFEVPFGVEVWVYFDTFTAPNAFTTPDAYVGATGVSGSLFIDITQGIDADGNTANEFVFTVYDATTSIGTVTVPFSIGRVYYLAATLNSTLTTFTAYVNGQAVGTVDTSAATFDSGTYTPRLVVGTQEATITMRAAHFAAFTATSPTTADILSRYNAGKSGGTLELVSTRLTTLADFAGLVDANLYTSAGLGTNTYLGPASFSSDVLAAMQELVTTEQGRMFVSGAGVLTVQGRAGDMKEIAVNATSNGTISDSGSLTYTEIEISPATVDLLRNVEYVTVGDSILFAADTGSRAQFGERSESISTALADPTAGKNLGLSRVRRFADPTTRFQSLTLTPRSTSDSRLTTALTTELGYRYVITRTPQNVGSAISKTVAVEGIIHQFDGVTWETTLYLAPAQTAYTAQPWFVMGDATYGQLGTSAGNELPY